MTTKNVTVFVLGFLTAIFLTLVTAMLANAAELRWDAYDDQATIDGFVVYACAIGDTDVRSVVIRDPSATAYAINPIYFRPGETYEFWLTAFNAASESGPSNKPTWTAPVFSPPDRPPDVIITIPHAVGGVQVNIQ